MAEWLSSKNSCPQCRADLPLLTPRLLAPTTDDDQTTIDEDLLQTIDSTSASIYEQGDDMYIMDDTTMEQPDTGMNDDTGTYMDDIGDDTIANILEQMVAADAPPYCHQGNCNNRSARDCNNACCGRCCVAHGQFSCPRHNVA
jgi:hypothetical protein